MKNTKIEWADSTWNPWVGCKNCYAEGWAQKERPAWLEGGDHG